MYIASIVPNKDLIQDHPTCLRNFMTWPARRSTTAIAHRSTLPIEMDVIDCLTTCSPTCVLPASALAALLLLLPPEALPAPVEVHKLKSSFDLGFGTRAEGYSPSGLQRPKGSYMQMAGCRGCGAPLMVRGRPASVPSMQKRLCGWRAVRSAEALLG